MRERKVKSAQKTVECDHCLVVVSKKHLPQHTCGAAEPSFSVINIPKETNDFSRFLESLRNDDTSKAIRADSFIMEIGCGYFAKYGNGNNFADIRISCSRLLRNIAKLLNKVDGYREGLLPCVFYKDKVDAVIDAIN